MKNLIDSIVSFWKNNTHGLIIFLLFLFCFLSKENHPLHVMEQNIASLLTSVNIFDTYDQESKIVREVSRYLPSTGSIGCIVTNLLRNEGGQRFYIDQYKFIPLVLDRTSVYRHDYVLVHCPESNYFEIKKELKSSNFSVVYEKISDLEPDNYTIFFRNKK